MTGSPWTGAEVTWLTLTWIGSAAVAVGVAVTTSVGPVLLVLAPDHGIHLGDVLGLVCATAFGVRVTRTITARHR